MSQQLSYATGFYDFYDKLALTQMTTPADMPTHTTAPWTIAKSARKASCQYSAAWGCKVLQGLLMQDAYQKG
jgi:hypothetical protein